MNDNYLTIDLNRVIKVFTKNKMLFLKTLLINIVLILAVSFVMKPRYVSSFVLMPNQSSNISDLVSTAALLGIGNSQTSDKETFNTPDIIEELLKSRSFSDMLYEKTISINGMDNKVPNLFFSDNEIFTREDFRNKIKDFIYIKKDPETGIYTINFYYNNPNLSYEICNLILDTLLDLRQQILLSLTEEEKQFITKKIDYLNSTMISIENDLIFFVNENLNYKSSPALDIKYSRIKSNLDLTSNLYYSYQQKLEELFLEEKGTLSGLIIIDKPHISDKPSFPTLVYFLMLFIISSIFINAPIIIYKKF